MPITETKSTEGFLFTEPVCSETAVWCELSPEVDPVEWAGLCRRIGQMTVAELLKVRDCISQLSDRSGCRDGDYPLISFGPSGVRGEYQREFE